MTSEPHPWVEPCHVCGGVGRKDAIVTCSKCCIAREHVYCMRVHTKVIPQIWVCEECLSSNSRVLPKSVQEDEFLDSRDITHTAAPSKVSVDSQGQKTGKVNYIPAAEAYMLSSRDQVKETSKSNNSRTAMSSKNVIPKLSIPIVQKNHKFKCPVAENSRLSSGAHGREPLPSNNSRTAMPSKNVNPKFAVPIVKDYPSFKLPVAENSRLSSGAQGRELASNNSRKAMDDNPSFKLPVAENSRLSSGAQGRELTSNNSRKVMPSKNIIPKFSVRTVKENPSSKRPVAENSRLLSGAQGRESLTSHNSRTDVPSKNVIRKVPVPIEKENPSFKLPVADVAWLTSGAKRKKLHESNNFRTTMPAKNVIPNFSIPRVKANHGGAQIITKIDQQTAKTSETSQEECRDKQWPVATFMPSKEVTKFKPVTKEVKTPNTITDYASNEASYGSPTPMCSLPISTGHLPANAGKNFPFEERVLPNVLPKLELYCRYLPSLEATWNGGFLFPETATPDEVYGGFQAHSPCKSRSKAFEFSQKLPKDLQIKLVPRFPIWKNLFGDGSPDFHDIGLYFFPADNTERSRQNYSCLFDFLEAKNLVMRSYIDGVELLISTSKQLHVDSQKIISRSSTQDFFWGLFRQVKNCQMIHKAYEEFLLSIAKSEGSQGEDKVELGLTSDTTTAVHMKVEPEDKVDKAECVDMYPSPANLMVPSMDPSVLAYEKGDPNMPNIVYKNADSVRKRKRGKYLQLPWTDPDKTKRTKLTDKANAITDEPGLEDDYREFLQSKNLIRVYTGQIEYMYPDDFRSMDNPRVWMSNLHIDSYMDVLWKRRSSHPDECQQDIAIASSIFFARLETQWKEICDSIVGERPKQKCKKKTDCEVWEEFPEFDCHMFEPPRIWLEEVAGDESNGRPPWWDMDSVLLPCIAGGVHWVLCHVYPKYGRVDLYDSQWHHRRARERISEISALLYFLPSILHKAGYYERIGILPRDAPFVATNISKDVVPQQPDSDSCGAYTLKMASFLLHGVKPSGWHINEKEMRKVREDLAFEVYCNGVKEDIPLLEL